MTTHASDDIKPAPLWAERLDELEQIAAYPSDWDGNGTPPPAPAAVQRTRDLFADLQRDGRRAPDAVCACPDRNVMCIWEAGSYGHGEADVYADAIEWSWVPSRAAARPTEEPRR